VLCRLSYHDYISLRNTDYCSECVWCLIMPVKADSLPISGVSVAFFHQYKTMEVAQLVKKFPALLYNPIVHYRVHKSPPLLLILCEMNPVHNFPPYFLNIHCIGLPSVLLVSGFPTNIFYTFLISSMQAT